MPQMKARSSTRDGLTLFEMLVVISVLSIISIMMFRILVVNSRENGKLISRLERNQALFAAGQSLTRDLESVVPYPREGQPVFRIENRKEGEADSDRVTFILPVRMEGGAIGVIERAYFLQREMHGPESILLLAWSDDTSPDGVVDANRGHVVTVLSGKQSVSFNIEASAAGERSWREEWEDGDSLPEKLRIHLKATDPRDPEHPVEIMETVYLMAG
jgi:prepilin-type N-terminal cleavage/methylation domain-containing protein